MMSGQFSVTATWQSINTIDVPDGEDPNEVFAALNRGELPECIADQITAVGAQLTDWSASV